MDEISKTVYFNKLLSLYENLLSETQKDILISYYQYNLSLSEIAEERNITRAAVDDALKKGQEKLLDLEKKLNLLEKTKSILEITERLKKNPEIKGDIEKIEEVLK